MTGLLRDSLLLMRIYWARLRRMAAKDLLSERASSATLCIFSILSARLMLFRSLVSIRSLTR